MREKIIEILDQSYYDGNLEFKDYADQIISTLIESLPEEEKVEDADYYLGRNSYRSEVINLLRGN